MSCGEEVYHYGTRHHLTGRWMGGAVDQASPVHVELVSHRHRGLAQGGTRVGKGECGGQIINDG